jgi:hypothetical protein
MIENFLAQIERESGEPAPATFRARARYRASMDMIIYIKVDDTYVADRVDHFLTLLWGGPEGTELIGLKLKGFRAFFLKIKEIYHLEEDMFLPLVDVLEVALENGLGDEMLEAERKKKYERAKEFARFLSIDKEAVRAALAA